LVFVMSYDAEIMELKRVLPKEGAVMFSGFPGPGLVGQIAVSEMVQQLKLTEVAHMKSPLLPPMAVFIGGILRAPIRIYANDSQDLLAIVSDIPIPSKALYHIGGRLVEWASEKYVDEIICLEGIPVDEKPPITYICGVAEPEVLEQLTKHNVSCHSAGYVAGVSGVILNECLTRKIKGLCLLSPATRRIPDPQAAAYVLEKVKEIYNVTLDVANLINQTNLLKNRMKETAESYKKFEESEDARMYA
jgi:uncharacterized protein